MVYELAAFDGIAAETVYDPGLAGPQTFAQGQDVGRTRHIVDN